MGTVGSGGDIVVVYPPKTPMIARFFVQIVKEHDRFTVVGNATNCVEYAHTSIRQTYGTKWQNTNSVGRVTT